MNNHSEMINLIWSIADLLRGDFKPHEYADIILPLTVFKRLDQVVEPTRPKVNAAYEKFRDKLKELDLVLKDAASPIAFYNTSPFNWQTLLDSPGDLEHNFINFLNGFSPEVQEIIDRFEFRSQVPRLKASNLLLLILKRFKDVDLSPDGIDNHSMGTIFEELIRKFSEQYNETAGEHFTPREVIGLMVRLIFANGSDFLSSPEKIISVYDPACGTGGMITEASRFIDTNNPQAKVVLFGQELNPATYAVAKSDMIIKGEASQNIVCGNSFSEDGFPDKHFDIMISNPPYGVEWKKVESVIRHEYETKGFDGRFGPGLPRVSDGSLLFLLHMISKMKKESESRIAIIFNGSPLFTGDAGSGESNIRRWIIEQDMLEAIVALPDQLFYNTGISTYVWILSNRKSSLRKGKIQLINAVSFSEKMKKSLGNKRNQIPEESQKQVIEIFKSFAPSEFSLILDNTDLAYRRIRVERLLRLNFQASPERIQRIQLERAFQNLNKTPQTPVDQDELLLKNIPLNDQQQALLDFLSSLPQDLFRNRASFEKVLDHQALVRKIRIDPPLRKAVLSALSERDDTAEICLDKNGLPEPDPDLRDYENVPYKQGIHDFFKKEVLPHVPDAWIDEANKDSQDGNVGIVGYEINFNRYFYKYIPPRPLEEIETEISILQKEINDSIKEI
jgi:type I restriction enzyme M protein